jgi:hypothetical protein
MGHLTREAEPEARIGPARLGSVIGADRDDRLFPGAPGVRRRSVDIGVWMGELVAIGRDEIAVAVAAGIRDKRFPSVRVEGADAARDPVDLTGRRGRDPPATSQRSTPRRARSRSMSAMVRSSEIVSRARTSSATCGALAPVPR